MKKTYILLQAMSLATTFKVGEEHVSVEFSNGFKTETTHRNGVFITKDENLQKAIESDVSYGRLFRLLDSDAPITIEDKGDNKGNDTDIVTVNYKKSQEAREHLMKLFPTLTEEQVSNEAKIIAIGLENKIKFVKVK